MTPNGDPPSSDPPPPGTVSAVRDRRIQYEAPPLEPEDLDPSPVRQWGRWHDDALAAGSPEPNAMTLATVDEAGDPDARLVLVRDADDRGLAFFTNLRSPKSRHLLARPVASGVFSWLDQHRQVRVRGTAELLSDADNDEYFASRPRAHQIGAWASPQSEVIEDRDRLDAVIAETAARFDGQAVARPPYWGGWRLVINEWEFWQGQPSRLHDRFRYRRASDDPGPVTWIIERLAP